MHRNQLSRARPSKNTPVGSRLCLSRACSLVLETFCHAPTHTFSPFSPLVLSCFGMLKFCTDGERYGVCVCAQSRLKTAWSRLKHFPVAFPSRDRDVTVSSLTKGQQRRAFPVQSLQLRGAPQTLDTSYCPRRTRLP